MAGAVFAAAAAAGAAFAGAAFTGAAFFPAAVAGAVFVTGVFAEVVVVAAAFVDAVVRVLRLAVLPAAATARSARPRPCVLLVIAPPGDRRLAIVAE